MRHRKSRHHLGRPADQRKAVLRTLATEFLRHGEIITTLAKAKALRPEVEKLITKGKKGFIKDYKAAYDKAKGGDKEALKEVLKSVHLRRQVNSFLYDRQVVTRVFEEIAPQYLEREGGYTRIIKYRERRGDNTTLAIIQLV
ncbi:50S ribosomal protein L17 [bacterium]|jgi:large subunit ribosomal protein L17|nr:50S ribosomal protein L17 [bacterium]QQR57620.1 MAG: 50S ribosomal protein L17 [Candidatus Melainabacteria bacterium]